MTADIVIESFRPGVIEKLGVGYEAVAAANPRVVYASVSGFGQTGPASKRPTVDGLIQAFTGVMRMNGTPEGAPHRIGMAAVDVLTGLYAFQAVSAAVLRQLRFSKGSRLDISMMQAAAAFQGCKLMEHAWSDGVPPPMYMPAGTLPTKDGHIVISAMRLRHFQDLFDLIGRHDIAVDPRLQSHEGRIKHGSWMMRVLSEATLERTSDEWLKAMQTCDIFCERVNGYQDYLEHPQVAAMGAVDWMKQSGLPSLPIANVPGAPPARSSDSVRSAPGIGEDTVAILGELGFGVMEIEKLLESKTAFVS